MMSCRGPQAFFHSPRISTGIGSGVVPVNTVQAVPCMPGRRSEALKMSTLPIRGRSGARSAAHKGKASAAIDKTTADMRCFMGWIAPLQPLYYGRQRAQWATEPRNDVAHDARA